MPAPRPADWGVLRLTLINFSPPPAAAGGAASNGPAAGETPAAAARGGRGGAAGEGAGARGGAAEVSFLVECTEGDAMRLRWVHALGCLQVCAPGWKVALAVMLSVGIICMLARLCRARAVGSAVDVYCLQMPFFAGRRCHGRALSWRACHSWMHPAPAPAQLQGSHLSSAASRCGWGWWWPSVPSTSLQWFHGTMKHGCSRHVWASTCMTARTACTGLFACCLSLHNTRAAPHHLIPAANCCS